MRRRNNFTESCMNKPTLRPAAHCPAGHVDMDWPYAGPATCWCAECGAMVLFTPVASPDPIPARMVTMPSRRLTRIPSPARFAPKTWYSED